MQTKRLGGPDRTSLRVLPQGGGLRADLSSVVEEEHRRTGSNAGADDTAGGSGLKINARVKNVWGPDGFNEAKKAPVAVRTCVRSARSLDSD